MPVREYLPPRLRGPLGFASLSVAIIGAVLGYIFIILGFTLRFNLNGLPLTNTQSYLVIATGVGAIALSYLGFRGFMEFSY